MSRSGRLLGVRRGGALPLVHTDFRWYLREHHLDLSWYPLPLLGDFLQELDPLMQRWFVLRLAFRLPPKALDPLMHWWVQN